MINPQLQEFKGLTTVLRKISPPMDNADKGKLAVDEFSAQKVDSDKKASYSEGRKRETKQLFKSENGGRTRFGAVNSDELEIAIFLKSLRESIPEDEYEHNRKVTFDF
jgi:hypothetical protein